MGQNNLLISYDLRRPGQEYAELRERILALPGTALHLQGSLWYVRTALDERSVRDRLVSALDLNDRLIVVNASKDAYAANVAPHRLLKGVWEGTPTAPPADGLRALFERRGFV